MADRLKNVIFQTLQRTVSRADFDWLQDRLEQDDAARQTYLTAVHVSEHLDQQAVDASGKPTPSDAPGADAMSTPLSIGRQTIESTPVMHWVLVAVAANIIALAGITWYARTHDAPSRTERGSVLPDDAMATSSAPDASSSFAAGDSDTTTERLIAGHATLRRAIDIRWPKGNSGLHEGDVLTNGTLQFDSGVAEIDFFCGATLIVEGPAKLNLESDWSAEVFLGRLRANVPPVARGFTVKAADAQIVDQGTEFALQVTPDAACVEVLRGQVEIRSTDTPARQLRTGQRHWLKGSASSASDFHDLVTNDDVQRRRHTAQSDRLADWRNHIRQLRRDERLIALYTADAIDRSAESSDESLRRMFNQVGAPDERDGVLVGPVERVSGRFGNESKGLDFSRTGARVRTRTDGQYGAFTFACWARIDGLDHVYNALFLADGYENGEPHWQIDQDGRLLFSVMVDDTPGTGLGGHPQARFHHLYKTRPFWNDSNRNQWFHLVAVYDPPNRRVTQYVNGDIVGDEVIQPKFHVQDLRIGPAEIGNWGQPLRNSPWFAVRNLNGQIDELAIYDAALDANAIQSLYQQGKPLGY
ncbi:LamG-like jellyroll fold domain-containing protein [Crateriforma conspicua]|uniref:LamG-like jellyroll fold domain-containing protein n=1 Tax=Crateriforma conspicua TaxID=2527996 RepID=UPI001188A58F|nr:LamG-like jellyroll fold domain-containing protein [Crateriforma conspicua]QDV61913.1 FecR protein [Crateriforma conspicua]